MSESVYLIRERGSGEPRGLPSPLIEQVASEKPRPNGSDEAFFGYESQIVMRCVLGA